MVHLNLGLVIILVAIGNVLKCDAVLPPYLPILQQGNAERGDIIECYYHLGMNYEEILMFIGLTHGIYLSIRQLKRILRSRGLGRRINRTDLREVCRCIELELSGSGSTIGYRQMTQRLSYIYGLRVDKDTVRNLLKILDPEGVEARSKHRLQRRQYQTEGPNHLWHIDGYDKLKPFGFCIHGAIDGYSRRIMWLEVGPSNNDPFIIAQYYIDCVRQIGGTPRLIRADNGTENVNIAGIQRFFHSEENSFLYGKSCANQRIEAWWSKLRKGCTDWWMRFFKDMRDCGIFCDIDVIHVECLRFCFMQVLRDELFKFAEQWNLHRMRPSRNVESPSGRPDTLYFLPEINRARNLITPVSLDDIDIAEQRCCCRVPETGCTDEFCELALIIMREKNLEMPKTAEDAVILYSVLIDEIQTLL